MKLFQIIFFILVLTGCTERKSNPVKGDNNSTFYLDTTYHFTDTIQNKILLKKFFSTDSVQLLSFQYFNNNNNKWELMNEFDSIPIPYGFETDHADYNGDKIKDFVFLADRGGRGSNYFEHLFLYDSIKKSFKKILGFEEVCAPSYDTTEKMVVGTGLSGSYQDTRMYNIQKDSIIQIKGEVWEDGKLIKKYKVIDGKEIVTFGKNNSLNILPRPTLFHFF